MEPEAFLKQVAAAFPVAAGAGARIDRVARGAAGHIWRLEADGRSYAVKWQDRPGDEPAARGESEFIDRAAAAGVGVARNHADHAGRYCSPVPGGCLRLADWIDGARADRTDPRTAARIGDTLGRLHAAAPPTATESDGSPPDPWYHQPPAAAEWALLAADPAPMRWAAQLRAAVPRLVELTAIAQPPDPVNLVRCHRDLHPDNALVTADGRLVVLDWDNLGPADPARELAYVLQTWFADGSRPDRPALATAAEAYRAAGGPGRIGGLADFTMAAATGLNFLRHQLTVARAPHTTADDRDYAQWEIGESLAHLPSVSTLQAIAAAAR